MVAVCWNPPPVAVTVTVYVPGTVFPVLMNRLVVAELNVDTEAGLKLAPGRMGRRWRRK